MSAHFAAQLDLGRAEKDNFCDGVGDCEEAETESQEFDLLPTKPMVTVCSGCNKPRGVEAESYLIEPVNTALKLDRLKEGGARFSYPESLSPVEWGCVEALQGARVQAQARDAKHREGEQSKESEKARLEALRRR